VDPKILDDMARKLADAMPSGITELQKDLEKNLRAGLERTLEQMQLVSRKEFDVQTAVLARTREKLEQLEQLVDQLEQQMLTKSS
jgi:BMFP domain-containing protein YqiC